MGSTIEIILALELYFRTEPKEMHIGNPDVAALSRLLNHLPIHQVRPDPNKFRNPNSVSIKLNNFKAIDPSYSGKGMWAHSKLDIEVFNEFHDNRDTLSQIAARIEKVISNKELRENLNQIEDSDKMTSAIEGEVLLRVHKYRERAPSLVRKKKALVLKSKGKLECEVCGFDFKETYGGIGTGFIECHHLTPLSEIDATTKTTLHDLALVCANCHRILHLGMDSLSISGLKEVLIKRDGRN